MNSLQGDLERIYDSWGKGLFACALSVTGCRDLAEDALQEAFTRLLRMERAPQNPKAYVFQCVRNAAIDLIRKNQNVRIKADKIEFQSQPYREKKESPIHLIAAPQILVRNRDKANIQILSNQRLEYFEKREDGFFELMESQEPTGLSIEITAEKEAQGKILLSPMTFSLRWVQKREAIPGLTLQVGKPILETTDYPTDIRITPGKFYGILLHPGDGQGILILRLKAELMPEETSKDKSSPTK